MKSSAKVEMSTKRQNNKIHIDTHWYSSISDKLMGTLVHWIHKISKRQRFLGSLMKGGIPRNNVVSPSRADKERKDSCILNPKLQV